MRVLGVFVLAGAALAQGPAYHEIASNGQLMEGMIRPAMQAINTAARTAAPPTIARGAASRSTLSSSRNPRNC